MDETGMRSAVRRALAVLGIRHLLFGIHDGAFPSRPEEDIGCGSPYTDGAADFLRFIGSLGFTGIQLGPQGMTTLLNSSPYDATLFSRNPFSLSVSGLIRQLGAVPALVEFVRDGKRPPSAEKVHPHHAFQTVGGLSAALCLQLRRAGGNEPFALPAAGGASYRQFCARHSDWLERDALYDALRTRYGRKNWQYWQGDSAVLDRVLFAPPPGSEQAAAERQRELGRRYRREMEDYRLIQYLLHDQHREFRERLHREDLQVFGDLQIGFSGRDVWSARFFLLAGYVLGAPPSRTNPQGQPWNYPVLDPRCSFREDGSGGRRPGPALLFLRERMAKLGSEYDGLRIDHPHGLVCPWVYRAGQPDPVRAVQQGARLFAAPDLADHPELAQFAIPRPEQLDRAKPRHDDNWVKALEPAQVRRYAVLFEEILASAVANGLGTGEIACEILSTQPYPIQRVMELHGLGRFRITQKADLDNAADVYRGENAAAADWIMLGNHDTPSIWQVAADLVAAGRAEQQAAYLAGRLKIPPAAREQWIRRTVADPGELAQAKCADLFVGPAGNVMIFFTDLLGLRRQYNRPGTVSEENWSLRIAPGYRQRYRALAAQNRALNLPAALAAALRSRGSRFAAEHRDLLAALDAAAHSPGDRRQGAEDGKKITQ